MAKPDLTQTDPFVEQEPENIQRARQTYGAAGGPLSTNKAKALMKQRPDGTREIAGCIMQGYGLEVPATATRQEIELAADTMLQISDRLNLWMGDLLASADDLGYGDIVASADLLGFESKTLYNWKSICERVPLSLRREVHLCYPDAKPLTMGHYDLVAGLPDYEQREALIKCLADGWSIAKLRIWVHGRPLRRTHLERMKPYLTRIEEAIHRAPDADRHMMLRAIRQWLKELERES